VNAAIFDPAPLELEKREADSMNIPPVILK